MSGQEAKTMFVLQKTCYLDMH